MSAPIRPSSRARGRVRVAASGCAILLIAGLGLIGCSGDESASSTSTTTGSADATTGTAPGVRVFSDPAQPITVAIGEQFAIVLDAEPAAGASWQPVDRPDPAVLLSIGTEFRSADETVTGDTVTGDRERQILRYGARAVGTAQIVLQYIRTDTLRPDDPIVTFSVTVIDPSVPTTTPPPTDTTPTTEATPTTAARTTTTRARTTTTTRPRSTTTTANTTTTP